MEVTNTMKVGVFFAKDELTTSVSSTLSSMFESTYGNETEDTFTCDYNQDGSRFTSGCMFQLQTTN